MAERLHAMPADQWVKCNAGRSLLAEAILEARVAVSRAEHAVEITPSTPPPPPNTIATKPLASFAFDVDDGDDGDGG